MKIDLLSKVIELKSKKKEFSIITDLQTAKNYVYDPDCKLDKDLEDFKINIKATLLNSLYIKNLNELLNGKEISIEKIMSNLGKDLKKVFELSWLFKN